MGYAFSGYPGAMPSLFSTELSLAPAILEVLERLSRRSSTPQQQALRARMLLAMAKGGTNPEIAADFGLHPTSVRKLRQRWLAEQSTFEPLLGDEKALTKKLVEFLRGGTSTGRPPTFTPEQVAAVVALACEPPDAAGVPITHWSCEILAEEAVRRGLVESISPATVGRFLKSGRPQAPQGTSLAHHRAR